MEGASAMSVIRSTLDVSTPARSPARRRTCEHRANDLRVSEHCLELVTFPLADRVALEEPIGLEQELEIVEQAAAEREEVRPRARHETLARAVNVTLAVLALVACSPIFLLIAIAIKLTSRGPIFYSQVRVGLDRRYDRGDTDDRRVHDLGGRPFTMHKFRSMHVNAEPDGRAVWALRSDPRVTLVGRVLRRTRLDELPQLINVIRGDMNIVGPRPERPSLFADLRRGIPQYRFRQRVKPGITGWAQINQCYDACVDDVRRKVQYDLEYLRRQGLVEDLRIMTMTLPVMLFGQKGW
jgi:lipopolysaccharide/colanic/teichoic acid biosynthesis glycosyltransferase